MHRDHYVQWKAIQNAISCILTSSDVHTNEKFVLKEVKHKGKQSQLLS